MTPLNHLATVCFCAGMLGALFSSLSLWLAGVLGASVWIGAGLLPELNLPWLYPQLLWGGLWALPLTLVFALPRRRRNWIRKGLWFSLLPSAAQLFYFFPQTTDYGMLGLALGTFAPPLVLFSNALWGAFTGVFTRLIWGRG
jgi:hypothetical protein